MVMRPALKPFKIVDHTVPYSYSEIEDINKTPDFK